MFVTHPPLERAVAACAGSIPGGATEAASRPGARRAAASQERRTPSRVKPRLLGDTLGRDVAGERRRAASVGGRARRQAHARELHGARHVPRPRARRGPVAELDRPAVQPKLMAAALARRRARSPPASAAPSAQRLAARSSATRPPRNTASGRRSNGRALRVVTGRRRSRATSSSVHGAQDETSSVQREVQRARSTVKYAV